MLAKPLSGRSSDPRLGNFETFLAAAHHLDYQLAADEVQSDVETVQKTVRDLETWSGRTLIQNGAELSMNEDHGWDFVLVCTDALKRLDDCRVNTLRPSSIELLKKRSNLRLSDLQAVLNVGRSKTFDQINSRTGDIQRVDRKVKAVAAVLGRPIFERKGHWVEVRQDAEDIVTSVAVIMARIGAFVLSEKEALRIIAAYMRKTRAFMRSDLSIWRRRKRLSSKVRNDVRNVEQKVIALGRQQAELDVALEKRYGVRVLSTSARHIDIDAIMADARSVKLKRSR